MPSTTPGPTPQQIAVDLRSVLARLLRKLRETTTDSITPSQASALSRLSKGGVSTVSALAHAERVRPQSMAAIVEALEAMGHVARSQDPNDGRRQIVELTDEGWAHVAGQKEAGLAWLDEALAQQVSEAELATLAGATAILERILD